MKYISVNFKVICNANMSQTVNDLIAALAGEAGCESFEETAEGLTGYAQKELFVREVLDEGIKEFPIEDVEIKYTIADVEDRDWNETWEQNGFEPIDIEGRLLIYDAKKTDPSALNRDIINIGIDAVQAFGTGTHETTRMMISTLLENDLHGKRVLDCGCGTGILGIAASLLGANTVVGYDIDEWSVSNAQHNAELNGVRNMTVLHGDASILTRFDATFDIVMANINRNILLADMPEFRRVMSPNATLLLSGFYEADIPFLQEKAKELGLKEVERKENGEWRMIRFEV